MPDEGVWVWPRAFFTGRAQDSSREFGTHTFFLDALFVMVTFLLFFKLSHYRGPLCSPEAYAGPLRPE